METRRAIVITDLDGTLLDHGSYAFTPALPALATLKAAGVPLVLCSSKTRAELLGVQKALGITGPFIPENGGAVCLAGDGELTMLFPDRLGGAPAKILGTPYAELRKALAVTRDRFGLGWTGFGDVGVAGVQAWTGLSSEESALAKARDFDEPFLWDPEPSPALAERVRSALAAKGLQLTRGGRFWHLLGDNDKGRAVRWLLAVLAAHWGAAPRSLALGDSENDLSMLNAAEHGVLVERPGGGHLEARPDDVCVVAGVGPAGWNRAVSEWFATLDW